MHKVKQHKGVAVAAAVCAVAMAASLFGKTYGTDYLFSTRATAVSTIFSALTIPAMVALCQLLGG